MPFSRAYIGILDTQANQAAQGITASHDALAELLESIDNFLTCLEKNTQTPPSPVMGEIVVKIIVGLFSTIALATRELTEGRSSKSVLLPAYYLIDHIAVESVKKFLRAKNVEGILQRLDRLTQDEARTSAAQILEVLHNLVQNLTVVMTSELKRLHIYRLPDTIRSRWQGVRSRRTGNPRYVSLETS